MPTLSVVKPVLPGGSNRRLVCLAPRSAIRLALQSYRSAQAPRSPAWRAMLPAATALAPAFAVTVLTAGAVRWSACPPTLLPGVHGFALPVDYRAEGDESGPIDAEGKIEIDAGGIRRFDGRAVALAIPGQVRHGDCLHWLAGGHVPDPDVSVVALGGNLPSGEKVSKATRMAFLASSFRAAVTGSLRTSRPMRASQSTTAPVSSRL